MLIVRHRLTLGLMGLDELHLRVLATSSEDLREKHNAQKGGSNLALSIPCYLLATRPVLRLMQKGRHWVLVVRCNTNTKITIIHTLLRSSFWAML